MQSYIGDRNETPYGIDGAILPDGTKVIAVARSSAKNGFGLVVFKSTDGLNWETNYLSVTGNQPLAGVAIDPRDGRIFTMRASATTTTIFTYVSSDFGATWTEASIIHGVATTHTAWNSMAWDRTNNRILITNKSTQTASTQFNLILQSTDFGTTWSSAYLKPSNGRQLTCNLASTDGGPYGIIGRITSSTATENEFIYTVAGNTAIMSVVTPTGLGLIAPTSTVVRYAYNPLSNIYLQYYLAGTTSTVYYAIDPATFTTTNSTITGLTTSEVTAAVCYSSSALGYVGSTKSSAATALQTQQRIIKSKYGQGGWLFEPTPEFNTSNIEIAFMLNDPATKMVYTYDLGSVIEGNSVGYLSIQSDLPPPSMTPTPSLSSAAKTDNDVMAAGVFTSVNGNTDYNRYALLANNGVDVKSVAINASANATIAGTLIVPNSNDVIIYGQFTSYGGSTANSITRIDRTGTLNTEFNYTVASSNGQVLMAVYDTENSVYFATNNGRLVKMALNGTVDTSWGNTLPLSGSMAIHYDPTINKFYAANATRIFRVNIDGTLDNTFANITTNGSVYSFAVQPDGKIVAYGAFTSVAWLGTGYSRPYIARFNTDGSLDLTWYFPFAAANPNIFGGKQLAVDSYGLYIGGSFTNVDGTGKNYMVRLRFDGRVDPTFNVTLNSSVYSIDITQDHRILICGPFTSVNGTGRLYGARLMVDGTLDTTFTPAVVPNTGLRTLNDYDQPIYTLTPTPTPSITPTPSQVPLVVVPLTLVGNQMLGVNGNGSPSLSAMVVSNNGSTNVSNIAVDPITGSNAHGICNTNDGTGDVFIYGSPNITQGAHTPSAIVRMTSTGGYVSTFTSPINNLVAAMVPFTTNSYLIIQGLNQIFKMDGNGVLDTSWGTGLPAVFANSTIAYDPIRGKIYTIGSNQTLMCVNEDGTLDTTYTRTSIGSVSVYGLSVQPTDGKLVILTSGSSGTVRRFNTNGTVDNTWTANVAGSANLSYGTRCLAATKDGVYIAGAITSVSGVSVTGFTRLRLSDGAIDPSFLPLTGMNGTIYSVSIGADSRIMLAGTFTTMRAQPRNSIARLLFDGSLDTTFAGLTSKTGGSVYAAVPQQ